MKKVWILGAAAALLGFVAAPASAQNPACNSADAVCVDTNDGAAGSGNPLVDVTSMLPAQGIVAAGQEPGYVFFDGDANNQDPLDGYLGLNAADSALLSGADQGNFKRTGGNASPPSPPGGGSLPLPIPPPGDLPSLPVPLPVALPLP